MENGQGQERRDRPEATGVEASAPRTPSGSPRRFGASRLRPRVEISRTPPPRPAGRAAVDPTQDPRREPPTRAEPVDDEQPLFGQPREFAGGRVRVYGCSPGCLIASLVVSLIVSCLLTALVNGGL